MVSLLQTTQKVDLNKPLMSQVSAILAAMGFHGRPQVKPKRSKLPMWDGMVFFDKHNMLITHDGSMYAGRSNILTANIKGVY